MGNTFVALCRPAERGTNLGMQTTQRVDAHSALSPACF